MAFAIPFSSRATAILILLEGEEKLYWGKNPRSSPSLSTV